MLRIFDLCEPWLADIGDSPWLNAPKIGSLAGHYLEKSEEPGPSVFKETLGEKSACELLGTLQNVRAEMRKCFNLLSTFESVAATHKVRCRFSV